MINENQLISGWGRNSFAKVTLFEPLNQHEIINKIQNAKKNTLITRGLGRSYGDSAQLDQETVLSLRNFNKINLDMNCAGRSVF